jgi:hypothetical protein
LLLSWFLLSSLFGFFWYLKLTSLSLRLKGNHLAVGLLSLERVLEKFALHRTVQAEIDGKKFDGLIPPTGTA